MVIKSSNMIINMTKKKKNQNGSRNMTVGQAHFNSESIETADSSLFTGSQCST